MEARFGTGVQCVLLKSYRNLASLAPFVPVVAEFGAEEVVVVEPLGRNL